MVQIAQIQIRSERTTDYANIAVVQAVSFNYSTSMGEGLLVSLLRSCQSFDPELSLVAELDGEIVGHVLFTPQVFMMKGTVVNGLIVGPVAVLPDYQKQGIGTLLMEEGHRRAGEMGYALCLLVGHHTYYPRFGYRTHMWGSVHLQVAYALIPDLTGEIVERRIETADIDRFAQMWQLWFKDAQLAPLPGSLITDWISTDKGKQTAAVMLDGETIGYLRYEKHKPGQVLSILAADTIALTVLCSYLKSKWNGGNEELLKLPLSADCPMLQHWELPFTTNVYKGPEQMLKVIDPAEQALADYCSELAEGRIAPGHMIWPTAFDAC